MRTIRNASTWRWPCSNWSGPAATKEKQSASQRVANIDQRLADITAEQTELLAAAEAELDTSALGPAAGPGGRCGRTIGMRLQVVTTRTS